MQLLSSPFHLLFVSGASFAAVALESMTFDWAYESGLKDGIEKVGDAVSGFFGKLGSVLVSKMSD
ncbi:hypothetical protein [Oceanobacillus sp. J11TS1]|uniref:hypothetical protein n=1 Tax=Oceanobacillus sp. J11TS1 TaxID=2807191 RepID=UPI001B222657|nr:hypothetical protein [Oceanobacillus sp. J11TS1]GIO23667.1 hypothetical protein J11TS1_22480 [Oceanobacillus sp. J11TS1]